MDDNDGATLPPEMVKKGRMNEMKGLEHRCQVGGRDKEGCCQEQACCTGLQQRQSGGVTFQHHRFCPGGGWSASWHHKEVDEWVVNA